METTPISLPWPEIAKLALGTGIISAVVTQIIGWIKDWRVSERSARRDATYLAMRVAVILEGFAIDCGNVINECNLFDQTDGNAGRPHSTLPALMDYPGDLDWKSLDSALASRALSVRNELSLARQSIEGMYDIEPNDLSTVCSQEAGKSGYIAWKLAVDLRSKYELPTFDPSITAWDVATTLKDRHDKMVARARAV